MDRLLNKVDPKALVVETMKEVEEAASTALSDKFQWDHHSLFSLDTEQKSNFLKLKELESLNALKCQLIKNKELLLQNLKNEQKLIAEEFKPTQPDSTIAVTEPNSTSSDAVQLETDTTLQWLTAFDEVCQLINEEEILRNHIHDLERSKNEITTRLKFKRERVELLELYLKIRKRKNTLNLRKNQEKKENKSKPNAEDVNFEKRQQRLLTCVEKYDTLLKLKEESKLKLQQKKELSKQYADLLFEVQESKGWRNKGPLVSRMMRCIMGCREDIRNFLKSKSKLNGEESDLEDEIDPQSPWLTKKEKLAMQVEKMDESSPVASTERNENLNVVSSTESNTASNSSPSTSSETEDFIKNYYKSYKNLIRLPRDAPFLKEMKSIAFQIAKQRILEKKVNAQLQKFFKLFPEFEKIYNSVNLDSDVGVPEVDKVEVDKESSFEKQSAEVNEEKSLPTEAVLSSDKVHVEDAEVATDVQYEEEGSEEVGEEKVDEEEVGEEKVDEKEVDEEEYEGEEKVDEEEVGEEKVDEEEDSEDVGEEKVDEEEVGEEKVNKEEIGEEKVDEDDEIEVDEEEEEANFASQLQGDNDFSDNDGLLIDSDEKYHELQVDSNQFMEMDEATGENWLLNVGTANYDEADSAVGDVAFVIQENDDGEEVITLIDDTDEYVIDDSDNTQYHDQQFVYADSVYMLPDTDNEFHGYYVENQLEQPMPEYIEHYENEPMLSQEPDELYCDDPMLSAESTTLAYYESGLNDDMNLNQYYFETDNNEQYALFSNYNTDNSDGYVIDSEWVGTADEECLEQQYPDFGILEEESSESEEQQGEDQI
ncbi:Replicase polyprotein 1a [Trichinella zimbabwensis]|uniref:Replicase polyprotein 1a n=1 Tax=Trichinella zimbabwensis TaxID=268475 RepID=A0A0V1GVJ4_9BILA|nr:Replicase polyprotein 1a [Trichinella zimbabwensis]